MKKVFLGLVVLLLSATSVWAEVEAPTMPASVAPESGGTYYLYNVESDMFLTSTANNDTYVGLGLTGRVVEVIPCDNGAYKLNFPDNSSSYKAIYSNATEYVRTNQSSSANYGYWTITKQEGCHLIQRAPQNTSYYNADQYLGWAGETSDYVYANRTANDAIHWQFITADDNALHYMAERKLYQQISNIQGLINAGYCTTPFTNLYANRAAASAEALNEAASQLSNAMGMSAGYQAPDWNERPILFYTADGNYGKSSSYTWALPSNNYTQGTYFCRSVSYVGETSSLSATVSVTEKSVFVYDLDAGSYGRFNVYVDGQLTRSLNGNRSQIGGNYYEAGKYDRFFEDLEPGVHTITWEASTTSSSYSPLYYVYNVGCRAVPQITVDLLEPGSMGTEVLCQTDHIKNVRRIKVRGQMNDDDWKKIQMMSNLYELDLSEAITAHVPESQFDGFNATSAAKFLRTVILPEGLEKIEDFAFRHTYVENVSFPQSCTKIGNSAFYHSHIAEAILSEDLQELGMNNNDNLYYYNQVFYYCRHLKRVHLGNKLKKIGFGTFYDCGVLKEVEMPDCITHMYNCAFYECNYET